MLTKKPYLKKRDYFTKYEKKARLVIEAILEKYSDGGILNYEIRVKNPLVNMCHPAH